MSEAAHWTFDEGTGTSAADITGNGNTGTLVNGATWSPGRIGPFCVTLDGISQYVSTPLKVSSANGTLSLWARFPSAPPANAVIAGQNAAVDGFIGCGLQIVASGGNRRARASIGSAGVFVDGAVNLSIVGGWNHIAMTWGSGGLKLCVGGVLDNSDPDTSGATANSGSYFLDVGSYNYSGGRIFYCPGDIDDVRVYSDELTLAQIAALANAPPHGGSMFFASAG